MKPHEYLILIITVDPVATPSPSRSISLLLDCLLSPPGSGGRSVSTCSGCYRPQRWRLGRSSRRFATKETLSPEGHTATIASSVRTLEKRKPHLSQPSPGENQLSLDHNKNTRKRTKQAAELNYCLTFVFCF